MNLRAAMLAPWRASSMSERVLAATVLVVGSALTAAVVLYIRRPDASTVAAMMMSIALGILWLTVMPKTLALAIDARELRLPAVQREIVAGLGLYSVLCIVLPTLILSCFGGSPAVIAAMLALACSGCFAVALAPSYLITVCVVFFLAQSDEIAPAPFWRDAPAFLRWALPLVIGLILLAAFNWGRALRQEQQRIPMWRKPLVAGLLGNTQERAITLLQPTMLQPMADIRGCGPGAPITSLRVALGGIHLPLMPGARIGLLLPIFLVIAGVAGLIVLRDGSGEVYRTMLQFGWGNAAFLPWLGVVVSSGIVWIATSQLQRRWTYGTEPHLLALLPRLHRERPVRHNIVLAVLLAPAGGLAVVTGVIVVAALSWRGSLALCLTLALVQLVLGAQLSPSRCPCWALEPRPTGRMHRVPSARA